MSVWFAVPSARSEDETADVFAAWKAQGYKIALWRDQEPAPAVADMTLIGEYRGYPNAVNDLCREIFARDPECMWVASGGDDMFPDPNKSADEIAAECTEHFGGTFGVMQPCGDRWFNPERICGSPFMGREFCRRMYGGATYQKPGPFCELFYHMWSDQEMHEICLKLGILWNRMDLSHYHRHWIRVQQEAKQKLKTPAHLTKAVTCYESLMPLYKDRERKGFPGHEPLPL